MKDTEMILIIVGVIFLAVFILPKLGLFSFLTFESMGYVEVGVNSGGGIVHVGYSAGVLKQIGQDYSSSSNELDFSRGYGKFSAGQDIGNWQAKEIKLKLTITTSNSGNGVQCANKLYIVKLLGYPPDGTGLNLNPTNDNDKIDLFNALDWESTPYAIINVPEGDSTHEIILNQQAIDDFKLLNKQDSASWIIGFAGEEDYDGKYDCEIDIFSTGLIYTKFPKLEINEICPTPADTNCDNKVSFAELIAYANKWTAGTVTFDALIQAANAWAVS